MFSFNIAYTLPCSGIGLYFVVACVNMHGSYDGSYEEGVMCLYLKDNGELSYIALKTSGG